MSAPIPDGFGGQYNLSEMPNCEFCLVRIILPSARRDVHAVTKCSKCLHIPTVQRPIAATCGGPRCDFDVCHHCLAEMITGTRPGRNRPVVLPQRTPRVAVAFAVPGQGASRAAAGPAAAEEGGDSAADRDEGDGSEQEGDGDD